MARVNSPRNIFLVAILCMIQMSNGEQSCEASDIRAVVIHLQQLITEFQRFKDDTFEELRTEFQRLKNDTEKEIIVLQNNAAKSVAFVARNPPTDIPTNDVILFSTTVLNSGDGYDSSTGRFTATVSGTYLLSTQLCPRLDQQFYYKLVVNNNTLGVSSQSFTATNDVCNSMVTVATMNSGDQAWVECIYSGYEFVKVVADSIKHYWNMFTGVLITQ